MTVKDNIVRVYCAGPLFGSGRSTENVNRALQVGQAVMACGAVPFVPHLFALWDTVFPHEADFWLHMDKHWLRACDLLVVLPGVSPGSRMEEAWAEAFGIPVIHLAADVEDPWYDSRLTMKIQELRLLKDDA